MADNALAPSFGRSVWGYIKRSVPAQLELANELAQGVAQPFVNLFGNGGEEFWRGPQDRQAAHDMRNALLTMMPSPAAPEAGSFASGMRMYRGSGRPEAWPPTRDFIAAREDAEMSPPTFWASSNPKVAEHFATDTTAFDPYGTGPHVMPAEGNFKTPLVIDVNGAHWDEIPPNTPGLEHIAHDLRLSAYGHTSTDSIANAARDAGHDALVIHNVRDDGPAATTIAAFKPGTIKSPYTGEALFSGGSPVTALPANKQKQDRDAR